MIKKMTKKSPAKSKVKVGTKVTIKPTKPGQKKITYKKGGLHKSLGLPQGQKIPAIAMQRAAAGHYGPMAKRQANLAKNVFGVGK